MPAPREKGERREAPKDDDTESCDDGDTGKDSPSGMAIASFVLGIISTTFAVPAFVISIVALVHSRRALELARANAFKLAKMGVAGRGRA